MLTIPWYLWILAGLAAVLGFWSRTVISSTYRSLCKIRTSTWVNVSRLASDLLAQAQASHIGIELISGAMMDHYDPWRKKIRISDPTSNSLADLGIVALETGQAIQHARRSPLFFIAWAVLTIARPLSWIAIVAIVLGVLRYIPVFFFWMLDARLLPLGLWAYSMAVFATIFTVIARLDARRITLRYLLQIPDTNPSPQDLDALKKVLGVMVLRDVGEIASGMGALQRLQAFLNRTK